MPTLLGRHAPASLGDLMGLFRYLLPLLALFSAAIPAWGRSGQAYIDGVVLRRGPRAELQVSFRVQNALDRRLLDTLDSGLPLRFTYALQIVRPREVGPDQLISEASLERTLVKDNLKDRYRVSFGTGGEERDVATLAEAQELMSRVEGARVYLPEGSGPSGPLRLRIKAKLQKFRLPFHLHYLFAFVSYWDVETDWYVLDLPRNSGAAP